MKIVFNTIMLAALLLFTSQDADAQFGKKLKNKIKDKVESVKETPGDNTANASVHGQPPLSKIWKPEVEPIIDSGEITPDYLKKVTKIQDWVESGRLSNDERRHIMNLFKRIGLIAKTALNGKKIGTVGDWLSFQIKDQEVIRYEAINQGKRPAIDGNPAHVTGFQTNWYCPDEVYNTPLHEELRKWFKATVAIVDYDLQKRKGAKFAFIDCGEECKGNVIMCYDRDGNLVKCKNL